MILEDSDHSDVCLVSYCTICTNNTVLPTVLIFLYVNYISVAISFVALQTYILHSS